MLFAELAVASLLIVVAGSFLTRYGDRIATKTGLGHAWVGLVLLAFATSLPELVTCFGAVTIPRQPDLVFGDVLGSNAFNLLILVLLDLLCGRDSVLVRVGRRAMLSAALGLVMMLLVAAPLVVVGLVGPLAQGAADWVGLMSPLIFLAYLFAMRLIFRDERAALADQVTEEAEPKPAGPSAVSSGPNGGIRHEAIAFAICAAVILGAGLWLSNSADRLATYPFHVAGRTLTLGHTFIGVLLLAIVTSLPELVVTVSSFRLGAHAMALGNLLGSNIFNIAIVSVADVGNRLASGRTIFLGAEKALKPIHALTALIPMLMTAVLMVGLVGRRRRRLLPVGWETGLMALIYLAGIYLVFRGSVGG